MKRLGIHVYVKDEASGALKGISGGVQTLGKTALVGMGVGVAAVGGFVAAVGKMAINETTYDSQRKAFANMTEGIVDDQDALIAGAAEVTAHTMSNADIQASALQAFGMIGADVFEDFEEDYIGMAEMSRRTGRALGKDTADVMEVVVDAISKGDTERLKSLGIMVTSQQAYEEYAATIGKTAGELDEVEKKQAIHAVTMDRLGQSYGDVATTSGGLGSILAQSKTWWANLQTEIGMKVMPVLAEIGGTLLPLVQGAFTQLMPVFDQAVGVALALAEGLSAFVAGMQGGLSPMDALREGLAQVFGPETVEKIMGVVTGIQGFLASVWSAIEPVVGFVAQNVGLQDVLIGLAVAIASVVIPAIAAIISPVLSVIGIFLAVVAIVAVLRNAWESNFLGIRDITRVIFNAIKTNIQTTVNMIKDVVAIATMMIQGDWRGAWNAIRDHLRNIGNTMVNLIRRALQRIGQAIRGINWGALGRAIIEGIARGISGAAGIIGNAARNAAQNAFNAAKSFLGIGSPSKLFEREIGMPIPEGAAVGIEKQGGEMEKAFTGALPTPGGRGGRMMGAGVVIHNHFGPDSIRDRDDIIELSDRIARGIRLRTGELAA